MFKTPETCARRRGYAAISYIGVSRVHFETIEWFPNACEAL